MVAAAVVVAADEEAVLSVPLFDEYEAEAGMLEDFFLAANIINIQMMGIRAD